MTRTSSSQAWPSVLLVVLALGCNDSFEPAALGVRVRENPDLLIPQDMSRTQEAEVAVAVQSKDGVDLTGVSVEWTSSDEQVLRVAPTGTPLHAKLEARGLGVAEITVRVTAGIGTVSDSMLVRTVQVHERWISVSSGRDFACGLNVDSVAYCWDSRFQPAIVPGLFGLPGKHLEVGHNTACEVVLKQVPFCWGLNLMGEMGTGDLDQHPVAVQGFLALSPDSAMHISAGGTFFCVVVEGNSFCFGNNTFGQLGFPPDTIESCNFNSEFFPCGVSFQVDPADSLNAGESHVCGILGGDSAGIVRCWGADATGQLGPREAGQLQSCLPRLGVEIGVPCGQPQIMAQVFRFTSVSAGWDVYSHGLGGEFDSALWLGEGHTCAISVGGTTYCWGKNDYGQLGAPSDSMCTRPLASLVSALPPEVECRARPLPVISAFPGEFKSISAGSDYTCGIRADDRVYCWGRNSEGQLGDGTTTSRMAPAPISGAHHFNSISAGPAQTCGITSPERIIFCWGYRVGPTPTPLGDPRH